MSIEHPGAPESQEGSSDQGGSAGRGISRILPPVGGIAEHEPPGKGDDQAKHNSEPFYRWLIIAIIELAGLLGLAYYACQAHNANVLTKEIIKNGIDDSRSTERAWIELVPGSTGRVSSAARVIAGGAVEYSVWPENVGNTGAYDIAATAFSINGPISLGDDPRLYEKSIDAHPEASEGVSTPSVLAPHIISPTQIEIRATGPAGHDVTFLLGRIDYTDRFRTKHWMKFCLFVGNGGAVRYCRKGNDEDRNEETLTSRGP